MRTAAIRTSMLSVSPAAINARRDSSSHIVFPSSSAIDAPARGAAREHERNDAGNEREGGHDDWTQPQAARFERGVDDASALELQLARELDDQNRVLTGQTHEHDQADLHERVVVAAEQLDAT